MKQNRSELERQERKLRQIRWYQILMSIFLITALIFIVCWAITFSHLKAQEKLRGNFQNIRLVIRLTASESVTQGEGTQIISQEETFKMYRGPVLDKKYYGKSLGFYLKTTSSDYFQINNQGFLEFIRIEHSQLSQRGGWKIISYSGVDVDGDYCTRKGVNGLLLDRVNIFVFQLQI